MRPRAIVLLTAAAAASVYLLVAFRLPVPAVPAPPLVCLPASPPLAAARPGALGKAYVTLCTNVLTVSAVLVQIGRLRALSSPFPMVVLVTPALPAWCQRVLEARGARVIVVEPVPFRLIGAPDYARGKWTEAMSKLRMFQQDGYERLVYLDADVLIQHSVDHLMDIPLDQGKAFMYGMLDLHDCMPDAKVGSFNSGLMVFSPHQALWSELMRSYEEAPRRPEWKGDQDLIAHTFSGRISLVNESIATMFVQCKCGRRLERHALVHGAGFLPHDALALYGTQNRASVLDCAAPQYDLWVRTYLDECRAMERVGGELYAHLKSKGFCSIQPYPGKDAAWARILQVNADHK